MKKGKKKKKRAWVLALLVIALLAAGGYATVTKLMETGTEEVIVYENDVVSSIDKQLQGIDVIKLREKESLVVDKDIAALQTAIAKGELSYAELTAIYLDRIKRFDKATGGINAVITVNPEALKQAQNCDANKGTDRGALFGIPVLLKDNINTKDMATSAGTFAMKDFVPAQNAPLVDKLIANGAIILGKANLSELANFVDLKMPSGYSSRIGQTHNPFAPLMMTPSGSSSGSAAAVAINLAAVSLGTETTGSIISPASIHSLVGYKPTLGLIDTTGVIPLSSTMDAVGPIAKTVKDAALLFNASVKDPAHHITIKDDATLQGKRIGVLSGDGSDKLVERLKSLGAEPLKLTWDDKDFSNDFIITDDFAKDFALYAKTYNAPVKTLSELLQFNKQDLKRRAKYGQELIEEAADVTSPDKDKAQKEVARVQAFIKQLVSNNQLDALVFMGDQVCILPCTAGYPEVTVPFGESEMGEPVGATFFALANEDDKLLNLAYAFDKGTNSRLIPEKYKENAGK